MRLKWKAIMGIVESIMVFWSIIFKFVSHDNPKGSTRAKPHYIIINTEWLKGEGIFIWMHTLIKGRFCTFELLSSDSSRPHNSSVYSSQLDFHFCISPFSLCYLNSCRTWFNLKKVYISMRTRYLCLGTCQFQHIPHTFASCLA